MNHAELEEAVIESFDIPLLSIPKGFLQPEILGTGKPEESLLNVNRTKSTAHYKYMSKWLIDDW